MRRFILFILPRVLVGVGVLVTLGLSWGGWPGLSGAQPRKLPADLEAVIHGPDYKHAHWGILFTDLETGQTVYELNADKLFVPASTTKLYTVATALDAFGPDHRFKTPVYRRGSVDADGQLRGDLILVASGDLTMGGRTTADGRIAFKDSDHTYANGNTTAELTEPDPLAGLDELARQVAAAGIKRVRGEVLIDDRLFEKTESTGSGPTRVTPILINDNLIDLVITPGAKPGEPASVKWRPETVAVQVDACVETIEPGKGVRVTVTAPAPGKIVVRGQIAADHKPLVRVHEVEDAAAFARTLFIEALRRAGVTVDASPLAGNPAGRLPAEDAYAKLTKVAELTSLPFREEAKLVLKVSHNLHASTLPLLVAVKHGKRTLDDGLRMQHDFLARSKVDVTTISFGGGAGGSRADYTTPRATVQLLRSMATRPDFPAYEDALPILGVDGTLAGVVKEDSPARGKVKAKTGTYFVRNTMNDRFLLTSKALAGYMTTARNRKLAFALFVNHTHLDRAGDTAREGKVLGRLCELVYERE
jgi:D-alanyl-D-alanine carboxypeptidase/D-alanyl-D-alanine-endopeptidase (penicillin-binding protein 4)